MIESVYFSVCDVVVEISSSRKIINDLNEKIFFITAVIPLLVNSVQNQVYEFKIIINEDEKSSIKCDTKEIYYTIKNNNFNVSTFAYTILTPVFATLLLRKKLIFLHGAVVEKDNMGFLLIGKGKSTTAVNLCVNYGFQLVAEDNLIYNPIENKILAKCDTINIDNRAIGSNYPEKLRIDISKLGIRNKNSTTLVKIFLLTSLYDMSEVIELHEIEKFSSICTFINERLLNPSRWNSDLDRQPPVLLNQVDFNLRDNLIHYIYNKVPVIKIASAIINNHKLIYENLDL